MTADACEVLESAEVVALGVSYALSGETECDGIVVSEWWGSLSLGLGIASSSRCSGNCSGTVVCSSVLDPGDCSANAEGGTSVRAECGSLSDWGCWVGRLVSDDDVYGCDCWRVYDCVFGAFGLDGLGSMSVASGPSAGTGVMTVTVGLWLLVGVTVSVATLGPTGVVAFR